MLHAMIMAGGGGTRFWPRSRQRRPKQFLTLAGNRSLLQLALDRIEAAGVPAANAWVITGEAYRAETASQLPSLDDSHIVGEPVGRDTAPCVGLGAALIARQDANAVMLVTPADHVIEPEREFQRAVHAAAGAAVENPNALITFGIKPNFPSTGYGYIQRGAASPGWQGINIFRVAKFEEKPAAERAEKFVASGEYYWNSGIFVWRAATILNALKEQKPALHAAVCRIADAWDTPRRQEVLRKEFESVEKISIDFAVMEKAKEVLVVEAPYRWDDVGSWLALERMNPQDSDSNTVLAPSHVGLKTNNCVIVGEQGKLITTIGVKDLLIIQDGDSLLIADRSDEGTVKQLVDELKKRKLEKHL
jgi:mannose-1-phosphate guanylyltransferase